MNSSIKRLDPSVASKIAAGEVAERPFNVVKELIENAMDAGATKITVEIVDGGLSLTRITDNGGGISETDLPLALERFATSKASSVEEVYNAPTFGFRGEALAAISAVSDFTLISGAGGGVAFEIKSKFGVVGEVKPAPPVTGTVAEAVNLFENVPARRKFLKSFKSLENEIIKLVKHFSLINHNAEINLISDGKEVFSVLAREDITVRASKVFTGKGFYKGEIEYGDAKVVAAATLPSQSDRLKRDAIVLGVNGRLIKDPSLIQAVIRAYYRLIPDGRYPCAAVDIRIPPADVDSNVHPAKLEVRFENPKAVFSLVSDAVNKAFEGRGVNASSVYSQTITGSASIKFDDLPIRSEEELAFKGLPGRTLPPIPDDIVNASGREVFQKTFAKSDGKVVEKHSETQFDEPVDNFFGDNISNQRSGGVADIESFTKENSGKASLNIADSFERKIASGDFKVIGQISSSFIICETSDGLILFIDQHAAHERILFEKEQAKNAGGNKATIVLHEPILADMTEELLEAIKENESVINGFGYAFSCDTGGFGAKITRIPYSASRRDVKKEFIQIASDLCIFGKSKTEDAPRAMLSCKSAIKAGDTLTESEMEYLVNLLFNTDNFGTCPHGRPIIYSMSISELARKFLR